VSRQARDTALDFERRDRSVCWDCKRPLTGAAQHNERIRCDECDAPFRATRRGEVQSVGVVNVPGIPQRTCVTLCTDFSP